MGYYRIWRQAPRHMPSQSHAENSRTSQRAWKIWVRTLSSFLEPSWPKKYLTANKIAQILQTDARSVHPDLSKDKISHFSSHSGRVRALVLLDEAGMPPKFVQFCLRWLGESFRLYLQDTLVIHNKLHWKNHQFFFCSKHHFLCWIMYMYAIWPHMSSSTEKIHPQPKLWGIMSEFGVSD